MADAESPTPPEVIMREIVNRLPGLIAACIRGDDQSFHDAAQMADDLMADFETPGVVLHVSMLYCARVMRRLARDADIDLGRMMSHQAALFQQDFPPD